MIASPHVARRTLAVIGSAVLALGTGLSIPQYELAILVPIGIGVILGMLQSPRFRLTVVIGGGILTLQSSQGLDALKLAYFGACGMAFALACLNVFRNKNGPAYMALSPLLRVSVALGIMIAVSYPVATGTGTAFEAWFRDSVPFLLLAATPVIVIDAASTYSITWLNRLLLIAGLSSAMSFFVAWINGRGLADLPIDRLMLSSFLLPACLFSYALAQSMGSGSSKWLPVAVILPMCFILTGTRTSILLLAVPIAITLFGREFRGKKVIRGFKLVVPVVVLGLLCYSIAVQLFNIDSEALTERLLSTTEVFSDSPAGLSFSERQQQTELAWQAFQGSPLFGTGPGYLFTWIPEWSDVAKSGMVIDSPLSPLADYGLFGAAVFVYVVLQAGAMLLRLSRRSNRSIGDAVRGYMAIVVVIMLTGSPFDDKGATFGFMILIAIVAISAIETQRSPGHLTTPSTLPSQKYSEALQRSVLPTQTTN